jgi:hypothetical protein
MKTKGITIWERHAEKIVLAVAVLLFVGFTALQFIGEPNAVSTSAGPIAPDEIDARLEEQARNLLAKIDPDAEPGVELPDPVPAIDRLMGELDSSLSPEPALKPFTIALVPSVEGVGFVRNAELPVPEIKVPDQIAVGQTADALVDGVVENYPDLLELFPEPGQPHDVVFATVAARFNLAELRNQMRAELVDEDTGAPAVIPSTWYNDRPENIVDLIIEREELAAGDVWENLTTLEPIPGQSNFRAELAAELDASLRDRVLGRLGDPDFQRGVIQPAIYPLKNNSWSLPEWEGEAEVEAGNDDERIVKLKSQLKGHELRLQHKMEELEDAGGSRDEGDDDGAGGAGGDKREPPGGAGRRPPPGGRRPPPGGGVGGGGGFGAAGGGGGDDDRSKERDEGKIKRLNREIDRLEDLIAKVVDELVALGVNMEAEADDAVGFDIEEDEILVWGHDLSVTPNKTYRYRVAVHVYNPFFGKKRSLIESQQHLAESFTIESEPSEWSGPVRVNPPLRVFITHATPPGGQGAGPLGLGRATAEVYRLYDGIQHMETFSVSPGGSIGGVKDVRMPGADRAIQVDFRSGLFVLDIVADTETSPGGPGGRGPNVGKSARVLLQDLQTGEILELRDPAWDLRDPDRLADTGGRRSP